MSLLLGSAVILGTIGRPLIGDRVFHAVDLLQLRQPWKEARAGEFTWDYGPLSDTVDSTMPNRHEFGERLRDGDLAWWNPYNAGGAPLLAASASGTGSPMNAPFAILPAHVASAFAKALEMLVASGFTFLFLRRIGVGRGAAILGGTMFMTSGFAISWTNWQHPQVAALIPAVFWAAERCIQKRTPKSVIPVAAATGIMVIGGFPSVAAWGLMLAGGYLLVRVLWNEDRAQSLRGAALAAGGIALGFALVAAVLFPFAAHLETLDLSWRQQSPLSIIDRVHLATTIVPDAVGSYIDRNYFGSRNGIETFSFLGAVTVALALVALILRPPEKTQRGIRTYFAVALIVAGVLTYHGGWLLETVQNLPVFENNFIGRMRAVIGFIAAVLAALGTQSLIERRLPRTWWAVLLGGTVALALLAIIGNSLREAYSLAGEVGEAAYVRSQSILPLLVLAATLVVAAVLLVRRSDHRRWQYVALLFPALFALEALVVVLPRFPTTTEEAFYPATSSHEFLEENLGIDRFAAGTSTMLPGTNTFYRLRSATGHVHHQTTWEELLRTVDPEVFRSPTTSLLTHDLAIAQSPILDRMAVRYLAVAGEDEVWGDRERIDPATSSGSQILDDPIQTIVPAAPLRGIVLHVEEPLEAGGGWTEFTIDIEADDGTSASVSQRMFSPATAGPFPIPIAGEDLPDSGDMTITISTSTPGGSPALLIDAEGEPLLEFIRPADDGLRLQLVDGVAVWERLDALPRVRWVPNAVVLDDPTARLAALHAGVEEDTIVLAGGESLEGGPGEVTLVSDEPERIEIMSESSGPGYVLLADPIESGWEATLDGDDVEILSADHALAAVEVPAGSHTVVFSYDPPARRLGAGVSATAWLVVLGLLLFGPISSRMRRQTPDGPRSGGLDESSTQVTHQTRR